MLSLVAIAVVAFIVTNLDDLVVLTAFCGHERYRLREVLLGQYLGFGPLVAVSLVAGVGFARFVAEYVRWLGIVPVVVGIGWYVRTRYRSRARYRSRDGAPNRRVAAGSNPRSRTTIIAGIGVTDGGDNIAVYLPLFATLESAETALVAGVLLGAAGPWVLFARWLAGRPLLAARLDEYGDVVLPVVLVGLGVAIVAGIV